MYGCDLEGDERTQDVGLESELKRRLGSESIDHHVIVVNDAETAQLNTEPLTAHHSALLESVREPVISKEPRLPINSHFENQNTASPVMRAPGYNTFVKRKPGRPRKRPLPESFYEVPQASGEPISENLKMESHEERMSLKSPETTFEKRRPGRPRRVDRSFDSSESYSPSPQVKRGKKILAPTLSLSGDEDDSRPALHRLLKRPRGRPIIHGRYSIFRKKGPVGRPRLRPIATTLVQESTSTDSINNPVPSSFFSELSRIF